MNVSQLQPPSEPQLQRVSTEAIEQDADFLALRLLNKRARVRLSPESFDLDAFPGQARLFAVANTRGWFAAAIREPSGYSVICSPLAKLRGTFSTSSDGELPLEVRCKNSLPDIPIALVFADNDKRLVVGFAQGSIMVYDTEDAFAGKAECLSSCQSITGPTDTLLDICPNPGEMPELVAILRHVPHGSDSLAVEIRDVRNLHSVGGWRRAEVPNTTPVALSWSAKGKQLAIGLLSGDIITFSPTATSIPRTIISRPSSVDGLRLLSLAWLSNTEFHTIYGPPDSSAPDVEQTHLIIVFDSKANTVQDIKLITPYLPFPGIRPPGAFTTVLRGWEHTKFLLFVGDSTSSDVGLIGSKIDASSSIPSWYNFTLEETSTPSVPLDKDMNDTVLLGLASDLTESQTVQYTSPSGEVTEIPPCPVMYVYASDGTVVGWHIINTSGVAYPGMILTPMIVKGDRPHSSATLLPVEAEAISRSASAQSADDNMIDEASGPPQSLVIELSTPAPSSPMPISSTSGINTHSISAEQARVAMDASFLRSPSPTLASPIASEDVMASDTDEDSRSGSEEEDADADFGGLSLGEDTVRANVRSDGLFAPSSSSPSLSTNTGSASSIAFSSVYGSGPLKPATGFGAFGSAGTSAFSKPATSGISTGFDSASWASAIADTKTSTSAFGKSSFGQPTFGQSTFGQSSFASSSPGQSAFHQSSFGQTSAKPVESKTSSAFGQFASQPSAFEQFANKPSVFGQPIAQTSTSGQTTSQTSALAQPHTQKSAFGQPDTQKSALRQPTTNAPVSDSSSGSKESVSRKVSFGQATIHTPATETTAESGQSLSTTLNSSQTSFEDSSSTTKSNTNVIGFGAFASQPSTFGQAIAPAFGNIVAKPSAFSTPGFGQPAFGSSSFGQATADTSASTIATKSASGQSTPSNPTFGQTSFGQSSNVPKSSASSTVSSGFEAFASRPSAFATSAPRQSAFGKSSFGEVAAATPATDSAPAPPTAPTSRPTSAFGLATPSNPTFGQTNFGQASNVTKSDSINSGGFGAFASTPVTFGSAAGTTNGKPVWSTSAPSKVEDTNIAVVASTSLSNEPNEEATKRIPSNTTVEPGRSVINSVSFTTVEQPRGGVTEPVPSTPIPARQLTNATKPPSSIFLMDKADVGVTKSVQSKTPPPPLSTLVPAVPPVAPPFSLPSFAKAPLRSPDSFSSKMIPEKTIPSTISALATRPLVPSPLSNVSTPSSGFFGTPETQVSSSSSSSSKVGETIQPSMQPFQKASHLTGRSDAFKVVPAPTLQPATIRGSVPSPSIEDGMQAECARLYVTLTADLEQLRRLAEEAVAKRNTSYEAHSCSYSADDLRQSPKWFIPDAKQLDVIVQSLENRVSSMHEQAVAHVAVIRDLESNLLKASTRKEEISRFAAASKDTELSKVLEARSLGPEHLEAQSQLRRDIRAIRERLQQLEDHIQTSKKRLVQMQGGKSTFRPPSLDTVNRTYRNIEIAIGQQECSVNQLATAVSKIKLETSAKVPSRDQRLPDKPTRPGAYPTPSVAISTAAALNAEMSAQRLKHALLTRRKEPLLNTQAVMPPSLNSNTDSAELKPPSSWFASLDTPADTLDLNAPSWSTNSGTESSPGSGSPRHRMGTKHHAKAIPLKKSSNTTISTTAPPAGFSWGPLPGIAPMTTLSADLRKSASSSQPATLSSSNS